MDERFELLHATTTAARLKCSPWWLNSLDQSEICPKQCALTSNTLSESVGLKINPLLIYTNPRWDPLGVCTPSSGQLLHPSDSTVEIWLYVSQTKCPGILCNGSEGFPGIWFGDLSRTLDVPSPSVAPSLAN
jgi:hypothetical protein